MIQTQLLRLDPPYQIISAGGRVGIQVATLIVTKEKEIYNEKDGSISDSEEYHSYPVVNYGLKRGLEEQMKYNNNPLDYESEWAIRRRLQPEGAVWQGVEVKDVKVLGLAGADNDYVDIDYFIYLIPTVWGTDPSLRVWGKMSTSRIYELYAGLGNVGMRTQKMQDDRVTREGAFPIRLKLEPTPALDGYYVKVLIKEVLYPEEFGMPDESVYFRCKINPFDSDDIRECAATILDGLNGIKNFLPTWNLTFTWRQSLKQGDEDFSDAMKQLLSLIKDNYKG